MTNTFFRVARIFAVLFLNFPLAWSITNGVPDWDGHPNVGATAVRFAGGGGIRQLCTGTLIAPDLFLTAAHCSDFLERGLQLGFIEKVLVTFHPDFFAARLAGDFIEVASIHINPVWFTRPGRGLTVADNGDIAVYRLSQAVAGADPATLPPAGFLDALGERHGLGGQTFTNVGFGTQVAFGRAEPSFDLDGLRRVSISEFLALAPGYLILSQNKNTGDGGSCFGDSGGPVFFGGTNMIVATEVQGDAMCRATNVTYRLDTPGAQEFLQGFVTVP